MTTLRETYFKEESPRTPHGPFKIGQFRGLATLRERLQYLDTRTDVEKIGAGSSRIAYFVSGKKYVMKLAKFQRGIAQNSAEVNAVSCGNQKYLPKIYAKASNNSWILVDSVEPLTSGKQFQDLTGYPLKAIEFGINFLGPEGKSRPEHDKTKKRWGQIYDIMKKDNWYRGLVNMAIKCDLVAGDVGKWDSWGVTKRGRIVLIDYGLTEEIWQKYYSRRR